MWKKLKSILWILFDEYLHYISVTLFTIGLFIEYLYFCIDLFQFIFLSSVSVLCFVMCYIQGVKNGEGGIDVVKMLEFHANHIKNLIENLPIMKDVHAAVGNSAGDSVVLTEHHDANNTVVGYTYKPEDGKLKEPLNEQS